MGRPKGGIPWNKGMKGPRPWYNTSGLNNKGGVPWNKGKKHSAESRKRMSNAHKATYAAGIPHPMLGKKHTEETRRLFKIQRVGKPHPHKGVSGPRNPFWKGGVTPVHRMVRVMPEYYDWRDKVLQRDNYTCLICQERGGVLNVDHIVPFSHILFVERITNVEDARNCEFLWEIENGRTLCEKCHKQSPSAQLRVLTIQLAALKQEWRQMQ
jgi:hypothetical protein